MRSLEEFAESVLDTYRAHLPAKLAAISTDDVPLIPPEAEAYYLGGPAAIYLYPSLEVAVTDWRIDHLSLGQHSADMTVFVIARAFLQNADFGLLYRMSLRWQRALIEVALRPDAFSDGTVVNAARGAYRTNPETGERDEFIGGSLAVFEVETAEVMT